MTRKTGGKATDVLSGARQIHVKVKNRRGKAASSTRWLERQLNDPYVAAAKAKGYRSRSAFKLIELDDRFGLLKPGARIVDLGAAPGGWCQVARERVLSKGRGLIVAVDIAAMEPVPGVTILTADFLDAEAPETVRAAIEGAADIVLTDMAAPATGHRQTDHIRTMALCEAAFDFAEEVLSPGGAFLGKVLKGGTENQLLNRMKRRFDSVRHAKPKASRAESSESYVVAMGFRG